MERAVRVGDQGVAAQVIAVQVAQGAAFFHGHGHAVEGVGFDDGRRRADLLLHVEGEEGAGGLAVGAYLKILK